MKQARFLASSTRPAVDPHPLFFFYNLSQTRNTRSRRSRRHIHTSIFRPKRHRSRSEHWAASQPRPGEGGRGEGSCPLTPMSLVRSPRQGTRRSRAQARTPPSHPYLKSSPPPRDPEFHAVVLPGPPGYALCPSAQRVPTDSVECREGEPVQTDGVETGSMRWRGREISVTKAPPPSPRPRTHRVSLLRAHATGEFTVRARARCGLPVPWQCGRRVRQYKWVLEY